MNYLYNGVSLQNKRQSNMDSVLLKNERINGKDALLAVVCDGVGSLVDGAFASGTATRMLGMWFGEATNTDRIGLRMRDAIVEINDFIISESERQGINTASTLSALLIVEDVYYITHVGDSRIYCYDNEKLSALTKDDISPAGSLTACIGQAERLALQYSEGPTADKLFLLCSDGLYKRMDNDFMITKIKTRNKRGFKESVGALTEYVIRHGEQDNISVALIRIDN